MDLVITGISDTRVLLLQFKSPLKILPLDEYMGTNVCAASSYSTHHGSGNSQITLLHSFLMQNTYYEECLALYEFGW